MKDQWSSEEKGEIKDQIASQQQQILPYHIDSLDDLKLCEIVFDDTPPLVHHKKPQQDLQNIEFVTVQSSLKSPSSPVSTQLELLAQHLSDTSNSHIDPIQLEYSQSPSHAVDTAEVATVTGIDGNNPIAHSRLQPITNHYSTHLRQLK